VKISLFSEICLNLERFALLAQQQMKTDIERVFSVKPKEDKQPKELKKNIEYSGCTLDI